MEGVVKKHDMAPCRNTTAAGAGLFLLLAAIIADIALCHGTELYEYTDNKGVVTFTDDIAKVPKSKAAKRRGEVKGASSHASEIPFRLVNKHIIVPVTLKYNGKEVSSDFVFDTGAALTVISPAIAESLDIRPEDTEVTLLEGVGGIALSEHRVLYVGAI